MSKGNGRKFQVIIRYHNQPHEEIKIIYQYEIISLLRKMYEGIEIASLTIVKISSVIYEQLR